MAMLLPEALPPLTDLDPALAILLVQLIIIVHSVRCIHASCFQVSHASHEFPYLKREPLLETHRLFKD